MTFLSWPIALAVAALAVPLLLLLYFLKLRRQERKISSTLLWKKAVQDLQVNAPFQKLRRNLLLFLQLLILAAIIFGIGKPVANFMRTPERNIVLLVDRSASMQAREADGRTRFEHAQDAATAFVEDLPDNSRAMVVSFADRASVVCNFTDDKRRLERLIRNIEPTDSPTNISEAMQLAVAYSTNLVDIPGVNTPAAAAPRGVADMELFSDGRISDADELFVTRGHMTYYRTGKSSNNVGIVGFAVQRDYERPGMLSVFAQVENFGPTAVTADLSISLDGKRLPGVGSVQEITLGPVSLTTTQPGTLGVDIDTARSALPASRNVIFEFFHETGGTVEVTLHHEDSLMLDNHAVAPIQPPREVRILCVSARNDFKYLLDRAFRRALEIKDVTWMTGEEFESASDDTLSIEGRSAFDLILLDKHDTDRLWPGSYLFFNAVPGIEGVALGDTVRDETLVTWKEDHPLLRNTMLDNVYISKWNNLTLPSHAVSLVEGEDSAIMAMITDPGHHYVITAFDIMDSDLPMQPAFIIFLQNAIQYLASGGLVETGRLVSPGETLAIPVPPGAEEVRITRPDSSVEDIDVTGRNTLTYARTHDTGIYRAVFDDERKTIEVYAANILDRTESLILPNDKFTIGAEEVAQVGGQTKVNEALWPYAVAAALLILIVEWWIYNKRVMI